MEEALRKTNTIATSGRSKNVTPVASVKSHSKLFQQNPNSTVVAGVLKTISEIQKKINKEQQNEIEERSAEVDAEVGLLAKKKSALSFTNGSFEGVKENKSFHYLKKLCTSGILSQRVAEVLNKVRREKQMSELDLFRVKNHNLSSQNSKLIVSDFKKHTLGRIKPGDFSPKLTIMTDLSLKKPPITEKSLSYDSLKHPKCGKLPIKCFSLENEKISVPLKTNECIKRSSIHKSKVSSEKPIRNPILAENPIWRFPEKENQQNKLSVNTGKKLSADFNCSSAKEYLESKQKERLEQSLNVRHPSRLPQRNNLELFLAKAKATKLGHIKKNNLSQQNTSSCENQALPKCSFNSDNGDKKISFCDLPTIVENFKYSNQDIQSNEGEPINEKSILEKEKSLKSEKKERVEIADKKCKNQGNESRIEDSLKEENDVVKTDSKLSRQSKATAGGTIKAKHPKKKEALKRNPNIAIICKNGYQIQILGQFRKSNLGNKKFENHSKVTNAKFKERKSTQMKELKKLEENPSEMGENKEVKALEELELLGKLFSKLCSVEKTLRRRSLIRRENSFRKKEEANRVRLSKSNLTDLKIRPKLSGSGQICIEDEWQVRRKNLRTAILQHVQNWLALDFISS